ncbi:Tryptophan synthase beta subunit-like PLP-dependent enzymes superfamily [Penicillium alfredii]|uniref:Tryptophan synthase beta subunit-like PLP-dependent enzymes superfamily n=1 Tax=Penicillium alfredii TaxID=1506179 RepID=A0A9W9FRF1_9EURO|nr:Tryptophan synthase beta subunit-like PLP-dependent enzymes superfamily [Penicillium alfredii]KAJ5104645.1 Tryptophan synthase beta subunit-like PLP-dependent enzymes superfamily [Penicillium alfredii]
MSLPLPEPFAQIPRYPLLYPHPSPIHPLPTLRDLTDPTYRRVSVFSKREDHSSPLACAGNKYRKLEYIIPDILSQTPQHHHHEHHPTSQPMRGPATTLITEATHGGLGAATPRDGGGLGASSDPAAFERVGNVQINQLVGALVDILDADDPVAEDATPVLEHLASCGRNPYWIPGGASLHPLGGLGYARAAVEIEAQEAQLQLGGSGRYDYIFVACGSGSTVGGLIAGFTMLEKNRQAAVSTPTSSGDQDSTRAEGRLPPRNVIGVLTSPTKPRQYHEERVLTFARRAGAMIGLDAERDISMEDVQLDDRFVGTAYGVLDPGTKETLQVMARAEGMMLDPVYTAKAARGMMYWVVHGQAFENYARKHNLDEVNVLFIHTGGQAALSAYAEGVKDT